MKMNKSTTFVFAALSAGIFSCSSPDIEKRIANLEKRVVELENGKVAQPAGLTSMPQNVQNVETLSGGPAPSFKFDQESFDFGTISEGEVVTHKFKFTNNGEAPLVIQNASSSCGCTVPDYSKEPIPVGGSGEITVRFDSQGKPGIQNKTVSITANTVPAITKLTIKSMVAAKTGAASSQAPAIQ